MAEVRAGSSEVRATATDELRRLLDERGVEWWAEDDPEEPTYYYVTKWFANGCEQTYEEIPAIRSRSLKAYCVTPEQAIAATLGRGTCHDTGESRVFHCSVCGFGIEDAYVEDEHAYPPEGFPRFCPNCGRKVVDE